MIARKKILIIITSIICVFGLLTTIIFLRKYNSPQFVITEINQTLKLSIPYNDITFFEKNGGGFHGDGDIIVILTLNNEENIKFQNNLDDRWMKLEQKSEIYNYLWSSETTPGEKAFGGMLNKRLSPATDTVFILCDYPNNKTNEEIGYIIAGNNNEALKKLNAENKECPMSYYLKAVIGARTNDATAVIENLRKACSLDGSFKQLAATDMEFAKFFENNDFIAITK